MFGLLASRVMDLWTYLVRWYDYIVEVNNVVSGVFINFINLDWNCFVVNSLNDYWIKSLIEYFYGKVSTFYLHRWLVHSDSSFVCDQWKACVFCNYFELREHSFLSVSSIELKVSARDFFGHDVERAIC